MKNSMRSLRKISIAITVVTLGGIGASCATAPSQGDPGPQDYTGAPPSPSATSAPVATAQPIAPAPSAPPPMPPSAPPSPPVAQQNQAQPAPTGQWVYTSQYGWAWMPYGNQYLYTPADPDNYPYQYVYVNGTWAWVSAPWVWGVGVAPWFGPWGPWRYGWYRGPGHFGGVPPAMIRRGRWR